MAILGCTKAVALNKLIHQTCAEIDKLFTIPRMGENATRLQFLYPCPQYLLPRAQPARDKSRWDGKISNGKTVRD